MYKVKFIFTIFIFLFLTNVTFSQPFELVNAFPNVSFSSPLFVTHANDGTNRVFIVQRFGLIKVLPNDSNTTNSKIFLDVTNLNNASTYLERGLLGLAFHPNYAANGYFYIYYTRVGDGANVLSRFSRSATDPDKADSLSEQILWAVTDPYVNHNGGILFFGLDGYLYVGMGDGGSSGDPGNRAQNPNEMLGKTHRVDVNTTSGGNNYGIPATNPFASGGGRPEIFTIGMRNPWRMSQDPVTGLIWCGDVGQNLYEEIDIIEVGKNYGWKIMEATHCYSPPTGCNQTGLTLPIKEYGHSGGNCSVTGGYVYRGIRRPELTGRYIYGDYCSAIVWKLKYENGIVTEDEPILTAPSSVYSFGTDQQNELYVCCGNGIVYRFNKSDLVSVSNNVTSLPEGFRLEQNYPNPFNPETNINYFIPELSRVKLTVFDATGKEISTLVNTTQLSGNYQIKWNGKDAYGNTIPSGVYFYNLTAGNSFRETKKMVMLK